MRLETGGSSSRIENYLGFPNGISGQELAARAYTQAQKFGAQVLIREIPTRLWQPEAIHNRNRRRFAHTGADGDHRDRRAIPEARPSELSRFEGAVCTTALRS